MNAKKTVLFTGAAVVIAGSLVYFLGVYPPAGSREALGAIGQREVYRADQAKDAGVTPGEAPVVANTDAHQGRANDKGVHLDQPDNGKGLKSAQPDNDKGLKSAQPDNGKGLKSAQPDNGKGLKSAQPDNDKGLKSAQPDK